MIEKKLEIIRANSRKKCAEKTSEAKAKNDFLKFVGTFAFRDIPEFIYYLDRITDFTPLEVKPFSKSDIYDLYPPEAKEELAHFEERSCLIEIDYERKGIATAIVNPVIANAHASAYENNKNKIFRAGGNDAHMSLTLNFLDENDKIIPLMTNGFGVSPIRFVSLDKNGNKEKFGKFIASALYQHDNITTINYYLNNEHFGMSRAVAVPKRKEFNFSTFLQTKRKISENYVLEADDGNYHDVLMDINQPYPIQELAISLYSKILNRTYSPKMKINSVKRSVIEKAGIEELDAIYESLLVNLFSDYLNSQKQNSSLEK